MWQVLHRGAALRREGTLYILSARLECELFTLLLAANRCGARLEWGLPTHLIRVDVPLSLLREPTLPILWIESEYITPISRKLGTVPSRIKPRKNLVVASALVGRVFDHRVALYEMESEPRRKERHTAA